MTNKPSKIEFRINNKDRLTLKRAAAKELPHESFSTWIRGQLIRAAKEVLRK
jgi:uncharacterized protein (DUF1778 family)